MARHPDKQLFREATDDLAALLHGKKRDFVDRVRRLFVEQPQKFMTLVVYPCSTIGIGTNEAKSPCLQITEAMERSLVAKREGDEDLLATIEHEVLS
jgi:hypothetical protein